MTNVKPNTKEQLVYYLLQNISLGTYDRRFLTSLQVIQATKKSPVTTNQSALLNKITLRYEKQLRKQEIDANEMVNLLWHSTPVESLPEYTDAYCTVNDNVIEIRSPFKKEFINQIKDSKIPVTWNKEQRLWTTVYCEYTLKHVIECLDKNYPAVNYCDISKSVINDFADLEEATCWDPTYVKVNGNYMIACTNHVIDEALKHITLDADTATLARLTAAGVTIDESILVDAAEELWNTDEGFKLIDFATTYNNVINLSDIGTLVRYLVGIKCDYVLILETFKNNSSTHISELQSLLKQNKIEVDLLKRNTVAERINQTKYEFPVVINTALWGFGQSVSKLGGCKTIFLGNNKPIEIK